MTPEERRTYRRERYARMRDDILKQNREWKQDNPERITRIRLSDTERDVMAVDGEGISTDTWYHHTQRNGVIETHVPRDSKEWLKWRKASIWSAQRQVYTLLAASNHSKITNPNGLSTKACLDFLLTLAKPNRIVIGFSITYDINMWLRDLPLERMKRLLRWGNIKYGSYTITWIKRKQFSVSRGKQSVTVWDIFGYCQSRFVDALSDWQVADEKTIAIIENMKAKRGDFDKESESAVEDYTFLECELCVKLMRKILECAKAVNVTLKRYDGAGSLAASLMHTNSIDNYIVSPDWLNDYALRAYFGGRFEMSTPGIYDKLYSYDINSAYPSALIDAPCLTHSEWSYWERWSGAKYALVHVKWDITQDVSNRLSQTFGPFPYRYAGGNICYPLRGEGWYWGIEVEAAKQLYGTSIVAVESYEMVPCLDHQPFAWLKELYAYRRDLKKRGDLGHLILKLGINSCYGKTAQNLGGRGHPPKYRNWLIAGWTTAHCRANLLRAIALSNGSIVSIATDGVLSTTPISGLPASSELGLWEYGEIDNAFLVRPNLYAYGHEPKRVVKCGGLAKRESNIDVLLKSFLREGPDAYYSITLHRFMGFSAALIRNAVDTGNCCWIEQDYRIGPSQHNRTHISREQPPPYERLYTIPYEGFDGESSPFKPKEEWGQSYEESTDNLSMLLDVMD